MLLTRILILATLTVTSRSINIHNMIPPVILDTEEEAGIVWKEMESSLKSGIESLIKQALPYVIRGSSTDVDINPQCMSDLMRIFYGVRDLKTWAFRILDATGKPPSGLMMGSSAAYGSYYECIQTDFPAKETFGDVPVPPLTRGQYCILEFRAPLPPKPKLLRLGVDTFKNTTFKYDLMEEMKKNAFLLYAGGFRLAVCVPSTCSKQDLTNMIKSATKDFPGKADVYSCETNEPKKIDELQFGLILAMGFTVALCILSTLADYFLQKPNERKIDSIPMQMLMSFSIRRNLSSVSHIGPTSNNPLESLNGIRALSMTWVILGHTYSTMEPQMLRDPLNLIDIRESFLFSIIANGYFSVQSFLVVTAILISYSIVSAFDSIGSRSFNIPILFVRRVWRLLPVQMISIGLALLVPLCGSGPIFKDNIALLTDNCRKSWWKNALFINNFMIDYDMCMPHTWYIAVDFHMFLLALVYFALLFRKPVYGNIFLAVITSGSLFASAALTYIYDFPPAVLTTVVDIDFAIKYAKYMYMYSFPNIPAYSVGLYIGTYLTRNPKLKLSKNWLLIGWIVFSSIALFDVYIVYYWNVINYDWGWLESVLYGSLHNIVWAISVGWVIVVCAIGSGGPVKGILSWNGFKPLVRISYSAYLLHLLFLFYFISTRLGPIDINNSTVVWQFLATLSLAIISAVVFRIFFEGPLTELDKVFMGWLRRKPSKDDVNVKSSSTPTSNGGGGDSINVNGTKIAIENEDEELKTKL